MAGRVADGTVLTELSVPSYVRWARGQVDAGRAAAGRTDPHTVTVYAFWSPDPDALRPLVAAGLRSGAVDAQIGDLAPGVAALRAEHPGDEAFAAAIPADWLAALTVSGPAYARAARLAELAAAGADTVVLVPAPDDPDDALAALATAPAG